MENPLILSEHWKPLTESDPQKLSNIEKSIKILINPPIERKYWEKIRRRITETEGWSLSSSDYRNWLNSIDKFCAYFAINEDDNPIGCLFSGRYRSLDGNSDNDVYSIGIYYVVPELRRKGLGNYLFTRMINQIGNQNVCLDGVLKMAETYKKRYGFKEVLPEPHDYFEISMNQLQIPTKNPSISTKSLKEIQFETIVAYDQKEILPGFDRVQYLKAFLESPKAITRVAFLDDKIMGVLCVRELNEKLVAGPFYADNLIVAETLVHDTLKKINWEQFSAFTSISPKCCTLARELFNGMSKGKASSTPFVYLQFTKKIEPAFYEKAFGIMEGAMSFI